MAIKINGNPRLQAYQTEAKRKISRNGADFDLGNAGLKKDEKSKGEDPGVILEIGKKKTEAGGVQKTAAAEVSARQKDSYEKAAAASKEVEGAEEKRAGSGTSFGELAAKVWTAIREAVSKFFRELWNGPEKETFPDALEEAERRQEGLTEDDAPEAALAETEGIDIEEAVSTDAAAEMATKAATAEGNLAGGVSRAREERPDTMEDFLNGTQRAKAVHNTDILTYYDRSGKMVKIRDKGRIIDGK